MIATTLEQSKKLLELGIGTSTADMYYAATIDATTLKFVYTTPPRVKQLDHAAYETDISAWSLSALLELMPEKEECEWSLSKGGYNGKGEYDEDYFISFETDGDDGIFHCESASNMIDAAFEMIVWLKENKYI